MNDFREGNIIFELNVMSPDQIHQEFVFEAYGYSEESKKKFGLAEWVNNAKATNLKALEITPSYGSSLSAVFENYTMVEGTSLA